eukprot:CAMPEP_0173441392 /NCGR_PEP_ID=MMETSP1357-20121228/23935_1 /TAXON_ID=77926 /ORGANISM="Hemiselmis rufescens, Strain PCC563" /LENGTH=263 /DNA_ID=CAMNT_0014406971 /DNA_START=25 /DNA_END=812 /DNA_ORIENTATION=+
MEFDAHGSFNGSTLSVPVTRMLPERISVIAAESLDRMSPSLRGSLEKLVDEMGTRSATAQGLGSVITTVKRMMHTDQRLYVARGDRHVHGILKVGRKKLFIRQSGSGKMAEIDPLCVLDFYVHESVQRGGIGKQLFEHMLSREAVQPHMIGYDRPSPKLIGFLRKHYNLANYEPQANNFVVFAEYFKHGAGSLPAGSRPAPAPQGYAAGPSHDAGDSGAQQHYAMHHHHQYQQHQQHQQPQPHYMQAPQQHQQPHYQAQPQPG